MDDTDEAGDIPLKMMSFKRTDDDPGNGSNRRLSSGGKPGKDRSGRRASLTKQTSYFLPPQYPRVHILERPDLDSRVLISGTAKLLVPSESYFAHQRMVWKDRFVFVDRTLGVLVFRSKDAYERRDKRQCEIFFYRDIAKVNKSGSEFTLLIKRRAQARVGKQTVPFLASLGPEQCTEFANAITDKIQIICSVFTVGVNGEFPENAVCGVRPNVAVCFSGGGGRAHACAASQMRALHYLGLLDKSKTDYITGVSAGAWATAIYTFYEEGAKTDDELFGPLLSVSSSNAESTEGLKRWTLEELESHEVCPILQPCLDNAVTVARDLLFTVNARQLWERVLGRIFLRPFGLDEPHPYCLREELETIKAKNPQLESVKFFTPRTSARPFWMCHGSIIGPTWAKIGDMLPIQFSPLYVGSPYLHKIHYSSEAGGGRRGRRRRSSLLSSGKSAEVWVGGGMVSPFVFGGDEPHTLLKSSKPSHTTMNSWHFRSNKNMVTTTTTTEEVPLNPEPPMHSAIFASLMQEAAKHEHEHEEHVATTTTVTTTVSIRQRLLSSSSKPGTIQRTLSDVQDAVDSLQLGPGMIDRVFKYAQAALSVHPNTTVPRGRNGSVIGDGIYTKQVGLPFPEKPFSLRHTVGISSDAPSVNLHERSLFNRLNVQENYWSPVYSADNRPTEKGMHEVEKDELDVTRQVAMDMGDGGSLDNLGLCAMLQRRVRRIVVFSNSSVCVPSPKRSGEDSEHFKRHTFHASVVRRLGPEEKSGIEDLDRAPTYSEWMDDDMLPLFGQEIDQATLNYLGTHHEHNHVFPLEELRPLLRKFQSKLELGEPIVVRQTHRVLENAYWGIEGGWDVDILWVYLDESRVFWEHLPEDTRREIDRMGSGDFARFPNYRTFGNNKSVSIDISLTRKQLTLLSTFTEWQVMHNRELFTEFMDSANMPEFVRQRKPLDATVSQLEKEGFLI
ncbi:hypothetical protein BASA82_000836 [Batrachochytrium salamandrivorans]|nr:hypothetical protein BASA82_000836 [Batrachochytrium salamandrivorans]